MPHHHRTAMILLGFASIGAALWYYFSHKTTTSGSPADDSANALTEAEWLNPQMTGNLAQNVGTAGVAAENDPSALNPYGMGYN